MSLLLSLIRSINSVAVTSKLTVVHHQPVQLSARHVLCISRVKLIAAQGRRNEVGSIYNIFRDPIAARGYANFMLVRDVYLVLDDHPVP